MHTACSGRYKRATRPMNRGFQKKNYIFVSWRAPAVHPASRNQTTNVNHADTSSNTAMTRLKRPIATAERQNLAAPRPR